MGPTAEPPSRYSTHEAQAAIAELLKLPEPDHLTQDWDVLVADPTRVDEFVTLYENHTSLAEDEKFALLDVILVSYDDLAREEGKICECGHRIRKILDVEFRLHAYTVYYWCLWDAGVEPDEEHIFCITRCMREIWNDKH